MAYPPAQPQAQPPTKRGVINYAEKETEIGSWHGSQWNVQFWLKTIFTLSLWYWLVHRYNNITLTTRRITQRRGNLFSAQETTLAMEDVTNVDVNQSLLGRMFNYGDISIQTAGSNATEVQAIRLADPIKLRETIFDLRDGKFDETK